MTLLEVLVVIIVIVMLISFFLPGIGGVKRPASLANCCSHLRQVDLAFIMYAGDNKGCYPMQVSTNDGGTREIRDQAFPHYQKLAGFLVYLPTLVCPADKDRSPATNYDQLADTNLSYFVNVDVSTNNPSASILAGDRNLGADDHAVPAGSFTLTRNSHLNWTRELHPDIGVVAFADGHVTPFHDASLNDIIRDQQPAVSHLIIP